MRDRVKSWAIKARSAVNERDRQISSVFGYTSSTNSTSQNQLNTSSSMGVRALKKNKKEEKKSKQSEAREREERDSQERNRVYLKDVNRKREEERKQLESSGK